MDFSKLYKLGAKGDLEDANKEKLEGKEDSEIGKIILEKFSKFFLILNYTMKVSNIRYQFSKKSKNLIQ